MVDIEHRAECLLIERLSEEHAVFRSVDRRAILGWILDANVA